MRRLLLALNVIIHHHAQQFYTTLNVGRLFLGCLITDCGDQSRANHIRTCLSMLRKNGRLQRKPLQGRRRFEVPQHHQIVPTPLRLDYIPLFSNVLYKKYEKCLVANIADAVVKDMKKYVKSR